MSQPALGFLLEHLRNGRGLSLRELANLAEVDHAYIYRLETGDKEGPSEDVLAKLIRALKAGKREADMLRYVAEHSETDPRLVAHTCGDPTVSYDVFAAVAATVHRGSGRADYASQINLVRRIMEEEKRGG
jgi:HTH-type transcriptional regulator, competence development regulator